MVKIIATSYAIQRECVHELGYIWQQLGFQKEKTIRGTD